MTFTFETKNNATSKTSSGLGQKTAKHIEKNTEKQATQIPELQTQAKSTDPALQDTIANLAKRKTLKTMNALKIVNPIIIAIMLNPGEDVNENFKNLIKTTADLSARTCNLLGLNPNEEKNFWIRNVFERIFSDICREQWVSKGKIDSEVLMQLVQELTQNNDFVESEYQALGLPIDLDVQMTLLKSMIPVVAEMKSGFDMHRKIENDLDHITQVIFSAAKAGLLKIVDENADTRQKADLLKLLVQEASKMYAVSWKNYTTYAKNYFEQSAPAEKKKLQQKYPQGFPIKSIEEDFASNFDRLLVVTQKIIPARNTSPEKKLK